jgi:8-oxo-dGTP diphosphatase
MSKKPPIPPAIPCVGVVVLRGADVLIVKRKYPPNAGAWSIPGGKVESGEDFETAVHRELAEETGIHAEIIGKITTIDAKFGDTHYLLHDYAARWVSGEPVAADDASEAMFMSPGALNKLELWDKTIEVIAQARQIVDSAETR